MELFPNHEFMLSIDPGDTLYFLIAKTSLEREAKYQIRVSYLGTVGASLAINWEPCSKEITGGVKMLDTDMLSFSTDSDGKSSQTSVTGISSTSAACGPLRASQAAPPQYGSM